MTADDAIVKVMIEVRRDSRWLRYYANLNDKNGEREMNDRELRIRTSQNSMSKYYCDLHLADNKAEIYCSMLSDYYRVIISRWRLSNHRLNIETGRYTNPITERKDRVCTMCRVVEDEHHVVFDCPRYTNIRNQYNHLTNNHNITTFLQPSYNDMIDTATFIYAIEKKRNDLKL